MGTIVSCFFLLFSYGLNFIHSQGGKHETVYGSSPGTSLHSSTYEYVLPAHTSSHGDEHSSMSHYTPHALFEICLKSFQQNIRFTCIVFQVPFPILVPPKTRDMNDAAVQSEIFIADKETQEIQSVSSPGEGLEKVVCNIFAIFLWNKKSSHLSVFKIL